MYIPSQMLLMSQIIRNNQIQIKRREEENKNKIKEEKENEIYSTRNDKR